ncbi:MAG: HD-GYP domain-containing protein [Chloroflexota bacterium]|nr:HD-GYP domain-containing protein [Chloroflexota bacterium]
MGVRVFPRASPRSGSPIRVALAIVALLSAIAVAIGLGALYSVTLGKGESLDGLVRDVQLTTAGIMTAEAAVLWLLLKRAYGRTSDQMGAQARALEAALSESESAYDSTLRALSLALDVRDRETEGHAQRVARYMDLMARELRSANVDIRTLRRGALLHDLGKIGIPDEILRKTGELDGSEWRVMKRHPAYGARILAGIPYLSGAAEIVRHHHEHFDGSGYPDGLAGEDIPLGARIFALADALDAMTSDRPYRRAMSLEDAISEIERCSGKQFDPVMVNAFLRIPVDRLSAVRSDAGPLEHFADAIG